MTLCQDAPLCPPINHRSPRWWCKSKLKNPCLVSYPPTTSCRRRVEHLHPGTLVAALGGGGLLCVSPEGVRIFGEDGLPLLGGGRPSGQDLMINAPVSARHHCPWGPNAPAAVMLLLNTAVGGGEARNDQEGREMTGETYKYRQLCGLTAVVAVRARRRKLAERKT